MAQKSHIKSLIERHNGLCHYCSKETNRVLGHPRMATKEHVVPKSYGGANSINNYVLACSTCNNERGTKLWACSCDFCAPLIERALKHQKFYDNLFFSMVEFNRIKVVKRNNCKWVVKFGHMSKAFDSWEEAIEFVNESESCIGFRKIGSRPS